MYLQVLCSDGTATEPHALLYCYKLLKFVMLSMTKALKLQIVIPQQLMVVWKINPLTSRRMTKTFDMTWGPCGRSICSGAGVRTSLPTMAKFVMFPIRMMLSECSPERKTSLVSLVRCILSCVHCIISQFHARDLVHEVGNERRHLTLQSTGVCSFQ